MSKAFDINNFQKGKSFVIEASAGTGKTYNIVNIVEKLISSGVNLNEILIVTFTEKAAEELKNRIREKISGADVDNASIGTIHSFCQRAIKKYCISSNLPSDIAVIEESECNSLIKEYIRKPGPMAFITALKSIFNCPCEEKLITNINSILENYYMDSKFQEDSNIVSLDPAALGSYQIFDNWINGRDLRDGNNNRLVNELDVLKNSSNSDLLKIYKTIENSQDLKYRKPNNFNLTGLTEDERSALSFINNIKIAIAGTSSTSESGRRKAVNIIIRSAAIEYSRDLYKLWTETKRNNAQQTYNDMIRNVREEIINDRPLLDCLKKEYRYVIIDEFQDTNQKQWDIFSKVFLTEDHNIIVVGDPKQSIYSFQGSDFFVYNKAKDEIIKAGGDAVSLKTNYRACKGIIKNTNKFFKGKNALPETIGFEDSEAGKEYSFKYRGKDDIPAYWIYKEEEQPRQEKEEQPQQEDQPQQKKLQTYQEEYAKVICQTIIDCCSADTEKKETHLRVIDDKDESGKELKDAGGNPIYRERNVSFKDFAILTKTRNELPAIMQALEDSGIPYIRYKDTTLFNGTECAHWIAVLEAIAAPDFSGRNRSKFRKALFTRFFEATLEEINYSEYEKDSIPEVILFDKWRLLANDNQWENLINSIIFDTDLSARMQSMSDFKSLGIFKQIGDYCIEYLNKNQNIEALIINLRKQQKNVNDESSADSSLTAVSTDFDSVKIMTIHAAKGLEFPVVISVGGFNEPRKSEKIYRYHDGGKQIISLNKPENDENNNNPYDAEQMEEWQRLFYVAYTRAKYVLVLPSKAKGMDFIKDSITEFMDNYPSNYIELKDNGKKLPELKAEVVEILKANNHIISNASTKASQEAVLKVIIKEKGRHCAYKHAYSSLSHGAYKEESINDEGIEKDQSEEKEEFGLAKYDVKAKPVCCEYDPQKDPLKLSDDFPAGKGLGNAIHEVFELADYTEDPDNSRTRELAKRCFEKEGFRNCAAWIDDVINMVGNVCNAKLPVIEGSEGTGSSFKLCEIDFSNRKNEVEFNFNMSDEWLKNYFNGFIDLIIRRGEYYSVLDWKSDRLRDDFTSYSEAGSMKEHIDEMYSIQRVLYSYCLIKWLKNYYQDLSEEEIFRQHFGGVYYVCLRGCISDTGNGIYAQTWGSFKDIEDAYNKIVAERIGA